MQIIALEGIDKSGKETQSSKLAKHLEELGYSVFLGGFPRYETVIGKRIKQALYGDVTVTPYELAQLYELDRYNAQEAFKKAQEDNVDFLVLDRYTMSNMVFMRAQGLTELEILWMQKDLLQADLNLVIDISVEESLRRGQAYEKLDNNEKNVELLQKVRELQLDYVKEGTYHDKGAVRRINGEQPVELVTMDVFMEVFDYFQLWNGGNKNDDNDKTTRV